MAGGRWSIREDVSLKPPTAPSSTWFSGAEGGMSEVCLGLHHGDLDDPAKHTTFDLSSYAKILIYI